VRDDERLLERCLREIDAGGLTVEQCIARHLADRPEIADLLRAAVALRAVAPAPAESRAAHLRVGQLLTRELAAGPVRPSASVPVGFAAPRRPRIVRDGSRSARWARWWMLASAAVLLIGLLVGMGASTAAASALPGSPLYGLKRGEEALALRTAWSDERRGLVLLTIASHRLDEVRRLAGRNEAEALRLTSELDATIHATIRLVVAMNARGEDSGQIAAGLARTLDMESETLRTAQANGQPDLARALQNATDGEQQAIHDQHVVLPDHNQQRDQPTATAPAGHGGGRPNATPSPDGQTTPTAGAGNGNGNGGGNGNGAHPTPTPRR
jgi:uncharacterized protein DUF5667